ncbi:MAG: hypothetical protein ACFHW5_22565 [Verrucomicrobiota bacterium]|jgi:hypothetical protein
MFPFRALSFRSGWFDSFWLLSLACYAIHRIWQWASPAPGWMSSYWNDIWMLPCAVPLVIRIYETLNLREPNMHPSLSEIVWHGLLWSFMAEGLAPVWFPSSTADPLDLAAYALGGFMLWLRWHLFPRINHDVTLGLR